MTTGDRANGRLTATYSKISPHSELISPTWLHTMNTGTASTASGRVRSSSVV